MTITSRITWYKYNDATVQKAVGRFYVEETITSYRESFIVSPMIEELDKITIKERYES